MKTMTILGSTGSIGTQALEVAAKHNIKVKALAANSDVEKLAAQSKELMPERVCIYREDKKTELEKLLSGTGIKISKGNVSAFFDSRKGWHKTHHAND